MRTEGLLHILARLRCLNLVILHDYLVDFKSDLFKVLVLYLVKFVEVLLRELIYHFLLLFPLDLTVEIMANYRPNFLVHEKVFIGGELLRDLILESQVLDALTIK